MFTEPVSFLDIVPEETGYFPLAKPRTATPFCWPRTPAFRQFGSKKTFYVAPNKLSDVFCTAETF